MIKETENMNLNDLNNMNKLRHYYLAFSQGDISKKDAEYYIRLLSEDTLNYISHRSFNKRLIKPIMRMAQKTMEEQEILQEFDIIVNTILNDKREMFVLMNTFCF